jgi:hypothetical protein
MMISPARPRGRFEMSLLMLTFYDLFFLVCLFGSPGSIPLVRAQTGSIARVALSNGKALACYLD